MKRKALSLFSGGLDSNLSTRFIQKQGIEVEGVCFTSPFFNAEKAEESAQELNIPLWTVDITRDIFCLLKFPPHGFGKGANPCIDCHLLMIKKAGSLMKEREASFLITGEVLGERPKSQNRAALNMIGKESGYGDYLLRPLTAKNLSPTLPEREGWVKRELLLGIKGRGRTTQLKLAQELNIKQYSSPAGGCLLTDPIFSRRIKNLLTRGRLSINEVELLKVGRHFCLGESTKLIVGRDEEENKKILQLALEGDLCFRVVGFPGPAGLLRGEEGEVIFKAASIIGRYSDSPLNKTTVEYYRVPEGRKISISALSIDNEELETLRDT
ncbi:MAG: tRNA 4-thiouridine(8) synthase ThiI [Candidatus Aerophobetes bacterium]|nr:tRNA 4-thiouridine(8) synthase ThiI [Candidatus Aerophobetes bacterium]